MFSATSASLMLVGSSVSMAPGEITVVRMLYGLTSWRSPSENISTAALVAAYTALPGRTLWPATDDTLMMCPAICAFICGSAAPMPYSTPLILTSTIWSQSATFLPFQRRMRHQARVVKHHVDAAIGFDGGIDQVLHLGKLRDIGDEGQRFAALGIDLCGQCIDAISAACAQHHGRTQGAEMPRGRLAQACAAPVNTTTLPAILLLMLRVLFFTVEKKFRVRHAV